MKKLVLIGFLMSFYMMGFAQTLSERDHARVLQLNEESPKWMPLQSFTKLLLRDHVGWGGKAAAANNLLDSLQAAINRLAEDVSSLRQVSNLMSKLQRDVEKLVKEVQKESSASPQVIEWQRERLTEAVRFSQEIILNKNSPREYVYLAVYKAMTEAYRMILVLCNPLFLDFNEKEQQFFFRWNAEAWQKIRLEGKIVLPVFSVLPTSFSESDVSIEVNGEPQKLENGILFYEYTPDVVGSGSLKIVVYAENPLTGKRAGTAEAVQYYEVLKQE